MPKKTAVNAAEIGAMAAVPSRERPLDRIDRQILRRLQQDGRVSISELATEVHLSVSPCLARVRRLEGHGYISGYFAQLDPLRLGLNLLAYITARYSSTGLRRMSSSASPTQCGRSMR